MEPRAVGRSEEGVGIVEVVKAAGVDDWFWMLTHVKNGAWKGPHSPQDIGQNR